MLENTEVHPVVAPCMAVETSSKLLEDAVCFPRSEATGQKSSNEVGQEYDQETNEFIKDLEEIAQTQELTEKFIDDARKMSKKCLNDPDLLDRLEQQLKSTFGPDFNMYLNEEGLCFSRRMPSMSHWSSNSTRLVIPFNGEAAKGYDHRQGGCMPGRDSETSASRAAGIVFDKNAYADIPHWLK